MMLRFLAVFLVTAASCALPRSNSGFSLSTRGGEGQEVEFASSKDLRVAGLVSEGLSYANTGRLYDAEARLRQAQHLEPANDRIAFNVAVVINQAGESDEALQIMEGLLSKEPRNPNYLQAVADVWVSLGQHETARQKLKEAFGIFKAAGNYPRAALIARSIANIAFGIGNEQVALCYSYEALALSPQPHQVALHARLMVALNLFNEVGVFVESQKGLAGDPLTYHALAMANFARGEYAAALEAEDNALGRIAQAPELSQEITAAWWLMKNQALLQVSSGEVTLPSDAAKEKLDEMREGVIQYAERHPYELVMWPVALRKELVKVKAAGLS